MTFAYTPSSTSDRTVLARPDFVLMTSAPVHRLDDLWRALEEAADAARMLDVLTAGGVSSTPDFVLVSGVGTPSSVVMARGELSADITCPTGARTVDGVGVSSWVETRFEHVTGVQIGTARSDVQSFPLVHGIVRAEGVSWGETAAVSAGDTASPPAAEASVAPHTVEPEVSEVADVAEPLATPPATEEAQQVVPPPAPPRSAAPSTEATLGAAALTISPPPEEHSNETTESAANGYDHLFGATVRRSVEDAAVRADEGADDSEAVGDRTVVVADIAALRAQRRAERARSHDAPPVPRFAIELPSGDRELLDPSIIVGRAPTATRVSGSAVPRLVTLTTPNQDISRSHAQISVEGDTVVVTDLHSMNGTLVTVPGRNPQRLREGEPTTVITGTIIDLGDGATLVVREA